MAKALDGCLAVYPVEEFQRVAANLARGASARRNGAPGRPVVLLRRGRDHARQAGPGRHPGPSAHVRPARARGDRRRQLRPPRDLGLRDLQSARPGGLGLHRRRRRHQRLHVSESGKSDERIENTDGARTPRARLQPLGRRGCWPLLRPLSAVADPEQTSRAAPVDRGAGDGAGGTCGSGETVQGDGCGGGVLASPGDGPGGGGAPLARAGRTGRRLHRGWRRPCHSASRRAARPAPARNRP